MPNAGRDAYVNSVNLNAQTDFPYLVLEVDGGEARPRNPGFRVMHWHEDLQFILVLEGTVRVRTLDEVVDLSTGEGLFINRDVVHLVEGGEASRYRSFIFPEELVSFQPVASAAALTAALAHNTGIGVVQLSPSVGWCREALAVLGELVRLEGAKEGDALYPYRVLARLARLWLVMLEHVAVPERPHDSATSIRMRAFLRYIADHYAEHVSLEDIAHSGAVSASEALRCFKATLQTTPYRYLMEYRLQRAAELLRDTNLSIGQVAARCGLGQQSYFGRVFKRRMGCTPSAYRRQAAASRERRSS